MAFNIASVQVHKTDLIVFVQWNGYKYPANNSYLKGWHICQQCKDKKRAKSREHESKS